MSEETTNEGAETPVAGEAAQYAPDQLQGNGNKTANGEINLDLVLDIPVNVSLRVGSTDRTWRDCRCRRTLRCASDRSRKPARTH